MFTISMILMSSVAAQPAPPAPRGAVPPLVELSLKLSKDDVEVGEKVTLSEWVPADAKVNCRSIQHGVVVIGRGESGTRRLVGYEPREFRDRTFYVDDEFPGLYRDLVGYHGLLLLDKEVGWKGTEFEFTPRKVGVYLLSTQWTVSDGVAPASTPVVLKVRPKAPKK